MLHPPRTNHVQIMYRSLSRSLKADISYTPDLYDLYGLAHFVGGKPHSPHDSNRTSSYVWIHTVLYRSCASHDGGRLTLLGPQSRFGDNSLVIRLVCPQIGTAVVKGLRRVAIRNPVGKIVGKITDGKPACKKWP